MNTNPMQEASIPNPALQPLSVLIGRWSTVGSHPMIPDTVLHGRATFEGLENGAYLLWRSEIDEPGVPSGLAIFGSDDSSQEYSVLYFDERGVSREFKATLNGNVLKMWRMVPGFSQRLTWTIAEDGNTIIAQSELSRDDATWKNDLELRFTRAE